jgi:hypothetical protein
MLLQTQSGGIKYTLHNRSNNHLLGTANSALLVSLQLVKALRVKNK